MSPGLPVSSHLSRPSLFLYFTPVHELLHRVAVMAAGGMDTLPHCGAIITLLAICKLNHRQSYADIAAVTMLFPLPALVLVIGLGTVFGSF